LIIFTIKQNNFFKITEKLQNNIIFFYYLFIVNLIFIAVLVESADLKNNGGLIKPHPYVELIVDDFKRNKTEVIKNTYQPKWNEEFTVYVNKYHINLKVNHS